jgi:hypothetical protein
MQFNVSQDGALSQSESEIGKKTLDGAASLVAQVRRRAPHLVPNSQITP